MDKRRKIGKAKERIEKVKRGKDEEVNGHGGKRGAPAPHGVSSLLDKNIGTSARFYTCTTEK